MKLRSAPLDDIQIELEYLLSNDGRSHTRVFVIIARAIYELHRCALLGALAVLGRSKKPSAAEHSR